MGRHRTPTPTPIQGEQVPAPPVMGPGQDRATSVASALDQANLPGARTLLGVLDVELDPLSFAEEFEHSAPDGTAVEEVLDSAFVANEAEALVDEQASDGPT
jgi:hypothetical protein